MTHGRFDSPVEAVLTGIKDIFAKRDASHILDESEDLSGKVCMVTGANSGLGFAIATQLAEKGARVIMACRSGIPQAGEKVKEQTGNQAVEMVKVDLSDIESILRLCQDLKNRDIKLDVVICNAGVAPPKARKTPQGLDEIFMVNYLAKYILLNQLLKDGTIPNQTYGRNGLDSTLKPRIIFVSSDSHRGASAIDFDEFGVYEEYGTKKAIANYSYYKLVLNTLSVELSRRLRKGNEVDVVVNAICPGPVNTNIARDAPPFLKGFIHFIFTIFFQSPTKAAKPVCYMAASDKMENRTNIYFHMTREKRMDEKVYDEAVGERLWEKSEKLLAASYKLLEES